MHVCRCTAILPDGLFHIGNPTADGNTNPRMRGKEVRYMKYEPEMLDQERSGI